MTPVNAVSSALELAVTHTIRIMNGGSVAISLNVDLQNNNVSRSSFLIGIPATFQNNLDDVVTYTSEETELDTISEGIQNKVSWFNVSFAEPLKTGETTTFTLHLFFSGLIEGNRSDSDGYLATFPENPVLPFDADQCDVEIVLPSGISAQESSLNQLLKENKTPLEAYTTESGFLYFSGDYEIIKIPAIHSEVTIESWGSLRYVNSYTLQNLGKITLYESTVWLPNGAEEILTYDVGGELDFNAKDSDTAKMVKISLRYPLRGSIGNTTYNDSATFTVSYRIDRTPYITSTSNQHEFHVLLPTILNSTIRAFSLRVTLPEGSQYQQATYHGTLTSTGLSQSITYIFTNITPLRKLNLDVNYEYSALWAVLRPGLWLTATVLIIAGIVIYRKKRKSTKRIVSDEHIKLIQTYIEIYDEQLMLWSDFDSLEESLDQKQIRKRNYNRRLRIVQQRLNSLARASNNLNTQIRQLGPHYATIIKKVENAESDIKALRETLQRLRRQYRSGRLTRRMYSDLTNDPEKKIERAKKIIESAIITLRSEL
jgi:hypothetical protein